MPETAKNEDAQAGAPRPGAWSDGRKFLMDLLRVGVIALAAYLGTRSLVRPLDVQAAAATEAAKNKQALVLRVVDAFIHSSAAYESRTHRVLGGSATAHEVESWQETEDAYVASLAAMNLYLGAHTEPLDDVLNTLRNDHAHPGGDWLSHWNDLHAKDRDLARELLARHHVTE